MVLFGRLQGQEPIFIGALLFHLPSAGVLLVDSEVGLRVAICQTPDCHMIPFLQQPHRLYLHPHFFCRVENRDSDLLRFLHVVPTG